MKNILIVFIVALLTMITYSYTREVRCTKKPFVCYDESRFYQCKKNTSGQYYIIGSLQTCPIGLVCNDLNEYKCEEDISKEFLSDQNSHFKFSDREGRKHIIDD